MSIKARLLERLPALLNKSYRLHGQPFEPATAIAPPAGRQRSWVHYGVMAPDLPAPHHVFNVLSILGTPGATVFDNDYAVKTTPQDTAYLLSTTAAMAGDTFRSYSMERECEFADDGSYLRFGDDLLIEGQYPSWTVQRQSGDVAVSLQLAATQSVSHFAHIPGLYDHWSLLCRYTGEVSHGDERQQVSGLCTFEYACGVGRYSLPGKRFPAPVKIPLNFFTYQIINLDEHTQLLLVVVLGAGGLPIQKTAYLRGVDDLGQAYTRNVNFNVTEYQPTPAVTPDGVTMRLPQRFTWYAEDDAGQPLLSLSCDVQGDFQYGLGAGYASWFSFTGECGGVGVSGQGYMEYIDRR